MTRICEHLNADGLTYCKQKVEDHHDHCEAGHPCPPVQTKPSSKNKSLHALMSSMDVDEIVAAGMFDIVEQKGAEDEVEGKQYLAWLNESLGEETEFEYAGTSRAEAGDDGPGYMLHFYAIQGEQKNLARGSFGRGAKKGWYLATACQHVENGIECDSMAYVRVHSSDWYGSLRLGDPIARRSAFDKTTTEAEAVPALCFRHRYGQGSSGSLVNVETDEERDVRDKGDAESSISWLNNLVGEDTKYAYRGTLREVSNDIGPGSKLHIYGIDGEDDGLARGRFGKDKYDRWYLVTSCQDGDDEHSCDGKAYVGMHSSSWWKTDLNMFNVKKSAARLDAFSKAKAEAADVHALCGLHRYAKDHPGSISEDEEEITEGICDECEQAMLWVDSHVSHHIDEHGEIDHERDADHVATMTV